MHGYVANRKCDDAVRRMAIFGRVMYVEMVLLTLLGIALSVKWWPLVKPTDPAAGELDDFLSLIGLVSLVFAMMWTLWGMLFRPITASIIFWRLEKSGDVLRLDRTVRRHRFVSTHGVIARVDDVMQYELQKVLNEAAEAHAKQHRLMTRRHELG